MYVIGTPSTIIWFPKPSGFKENIVQRINPGKIVICSSTMQNTTSKFYNYKIFLSYSMLIKLDNVRKMFTNIQKT